MRLNANVQDAINSINNNAALRRPNTHKSEMWLIPEFRSWQAMIRRCTDKKYSCYKRYGGRGITVCDRWLNSFEDYFSDIGPRPSITHTIDRSNNDGNYEPGNVRWATKSEQTNNRRNTIYVVLSDGTRVTLKEACSMFGLSKSTAYFRLTNDIPFDVKLKIKSPDKKYIYEGKHLSATELEVITGIKEYTLRYHLNKGKTIPDIIKLVNNRPSRILYDGKWRTKFALSKYLDIPNSFMYKYLKKGFTIEQILKHYSKSIKVKTYPYQGKEMTIRELELATGCKPKVLRKYLSRGHTVEETMKIVAKNVEIMKARNGGIYQSSTALN